MTQVLIADDNAIFREVLKRHVASLFGYDVIEADTGLEACVLAETRHPDLILLDLVMPGLDGIEVIRRIRANPRLADVPIIFLSAETDRRVWAEALSAGANDFMPKPYHRSELAARINLHLKLASLGQELRRQNDLLTRERYLAGCVQRQLLPRDMEFPGLESAAVSQAQEQVGGDFYDAWDDGAAVYVLMADISGHGASAAMLMAACKGYLVSLRQAGLGPVELVASLNAMLCDLLLGGDQLTHLVVAMWLVCAAQVAAGHGARQGHGLLHRLGDGAHKGRGQQYRQRGQDGQGRAHQPQRALRGAGLLLHQVQ